MLQRIRIAVIVAMAAITPPIAAAQQRKPLPPEAGTSTIAGRVIDAQTKEPIAGVDVTLATFTSGAARGAVVKTGADGTFEFSDILEGNYMVTSMSSDYVTGCYVNTNSLAPCSGFDLLRDQRRNDIVIALMKTATARGRVVDQQGAPVAGATVRIGVPQQPGNSIAGALVTRTPVVTGADGSFELKGLSPGGWNLELELPIQPGSLRLPIVFYPGVFNSDEATRVELIAGRTNDNLLFTLPEATDSVLTVRVSPGALEFAGVKTSLIRPSPLVVTPISLSDDGIGVVKGLLAGHYAVLAQGSIGDTPWAAFEIANFFPPSFDVSLQMAPAGRIAGRIVAQQGGLPPLNGVRLAASWVYDDVEINPLTFDETDVAADGSFRIGGLFGRRSIRVIGLPSGWSVSSILQGRSDVTSGIDVPLDSTVELTIVVSRQ